MEQGRNLSSSYSYSYMGSRRNSYKFSTLSGIGVAQVGKPGEGKEEFEEEDIWEAIPAEGNVARDPRFKSQESGKAINGGRKNRENSFNPVSAATPRRLPTASRMIPRSSQPAEEGNLNNGNGIPRSRPQSAPVNIPDWSLIARKEPPAVNNWLRSPVVEREFDGQDEVEEDDEGMMVPPHEVIARQLARSQIMSFSMCEGAGRTLKGRDLSRVRNAVLTRTGFLE
uniref:TSA: Wollemia nobilis Ref_Wollemi_Transcript_26404_834 transcribed RNA sequence n=1 Tax=Wollemia nobilis TaxID=56998 RepID=A0A0C9QLR4_9CONI